MVTTTASLISNHNRKKTIQKINKMNDANKRIVNLGHIYPDSILPEQEPTANVALPEEHRKQEIVLFFRIVSSLWQTGYRLLLSMKGIIILNMM